MRTLGKSTAIPVLRRTVTAGRRLRYVAIAMIVAGLILPVRLDARVRSIVVPVSGMTCTLCTRGVEESLRRLEQVADVTAELGPGRVRVESARDGSLDVKEVKRSIEEAGFQIAGAYNLEAVGRFAIGRERRMTFAVNDTPYVFRVLENNQTLDLFRRYPELKGDFVVEFRLHGNPKWDPPAISIRGFRPRTTPGDAAAQ